MVRTETATLGHILHDGFCDPAVAAVVSGKRIAGTAFTVRIPGADSATLHYALSMVRPGDILVIDRAGDDSHACWGGVVTLAARLAGIAGAVIDGRATDFAEIRGHDMPVWCRGTSSKTTKFVGLGGAINVPVSVGGVAVMPGDGVIADENGVVILKREQIGPICSRAIAMQENEASVLDRLRNGERLCDISGATAMVEGIGS
ncbi:regulator of RNase E activity RraA [Neorhizobium sp. 2083]|uniref:RraA family protein n=1 Tax=Neorhizobium sp. 2083 TaxID=2817762 RepID=UPI002860C53D|nr:RraA family protein [Neorhizobium sp. 2083]MDR6817542.1 regulator of RNase E activity RraA [Neorhizobium sp. 2083]